MAENAGVSVYGMTFVVCCLFGSCCCENVLCEFFPSDWRENIFRGNEQVGSRDIVCTDTTGMLLVCYCGCSPAPANIISVTAMQQREVNAGSEYNLKHGITQ